jgi:Ca2+-binding EF-hand superfamily protein
MARLFKMECNFLVEVEEIKHQMESIMSYNNQLAFKTIDAGNIGFIELKTLDGYFKRNQVKGITMEDNAAIIRRFDLDSDSKLRFDEF